MNPQELERLVKIEKLLEQLIFSDRYVFHKNIQFLDGKKIQVGTSNGLTIGTATAEKLAFHGQTPSIQQSKINDPSGQATDLDAEARTAINSIIDTLENKGLNSSS